MMKISANGLDLLKSLESKVTRKGKHVVYDDATGKPVPPRRRVRGGLTIGYGHLVKGGEKWPKDGIDERTASDLLHADLVRFELAVNDAVTVPLNQNEFDALVIFAFNIGDRAFRTQASAVRVLNEGKRGEVGRRMTLWNKTHIDGKLVLSPGLVHRRAQEVALFYTPVETSRDDPPPKHVAAKPPRAGCIARLFSWLKGD